MRGTSDRVDGRAGQPREEPNGRPPAVQTRRLRHGGEGVRIEVVGDTPDAPVVTATLMPEASRTPLTGAFLRRAVEAAWEMAGRSPLTVLSPAVTPTEARSFAEAGFVTTSELHLLTHDLALQARRGSRPTPSSVHLRRGTNRDLTAALEVDRAAFAPGWAMTPHGLANARSATPVTRLRVAEWGAAEPTASEPTGRGPTRGPAIVGYALTGRSGRRGYLQRLAVDPAHHRRGIGSALVLDAIRWCRRRGVQRLVVNTQVGNDGALELYRRSGFVESTGRLYTMEYRTPFPPSPPLA